MGLLLTLKEQGKTILVSIHDLNLARRYCDTISIIYKGELFYSGLPSEAFSEENIRNVFQVDVVEIKSDSRCFLYFHE
jgi:iron complex transport system ATP-binding protein